MMDSNEKDIFKKGIEKAPKGLSNKILNSINKEEEALSSLLQNGIEKAPDTLALKVMSNIGAPKVQKEPSYVTFWIGIIASFIGIIIIGFVVGSNEETQTFVSNRLNFEFEFKSSSNVIYASYAMFTVSLLLLVDFYFKRQRKTII